jgi:acetyltransferase-like isoleucine patch superfamily enzyme
MSLIRRIIKEIYYKFISANKVAQLEGVKFGKNCYFRTKQFGSEPYLIEIGDNFKTAGRVNFITHDGSVHVLRNIYPEYKDIDSFEKIKIANNVFIGYGAVILPGTVIEDNVIVGAGSIARGRLKTNSIYAGVPTKFICSIYDYSEKNKHKFYYTKNLTDEKKKIFLKERL